MQIEKFLNDVRAAFSDYNFDDQPERGDWVRVFVKHKGVSLGRISLQYDRFNRRYTIGGFKFYKPSDYHFEARDRFFYLFDTWYRTGVVPYIDFSSLVVRAKQLRREKIAAMLEWRKQNPTKREYFTVDSVGDCREVRRRRRKLSSAWMSDFRKLVAAELSACEVV
jgi:hypothetical protein